MKKYKVELKTQDCLGFMNSEFFYYDFLMAAVSRKYKLEEFFKDYPAKYEVKIFKRIKKEGA